MKVSSCYSIFAFASMEGAKKVYVDTLGCKVVHQIEFPGHQYCTVEDASGNRTDLIVGDDAKPGFFGLRVNVDDFEEALEEYKQAGAKVLFGPFDLPKSKLVSLDIPYGENISLFYHKK